MKKNKVKIEILLVGLIAICMVALIHISDYKMNEILLNSNLITIQGNTDNYFNDVLANELTKNKLDSCTMVEIYDKDFNVILRISAVDNNQTHTFTNLKDYKKLKELFNKYDEGHTKIKTEDVEEDIYFKWTETNKSEQRLALFYITRSITKNLWMIPFLCYLTLMLIFILVIRLHISRQSDRIEYYNKMSMKVRDKIFNK